MPCMSAPIDLVSWWPGDEDAKDVVGDNDGTLQNGTTLVPGIVGQAFSFDGVDHKITDISHCQMIPNSSV